MSVNSPSATCHQYAEHSFLPFCRRTLHPRHLSHVTMPFAEKLSPEFFPRRVSAMVFKTFTFSQTYLRDVVVRVELSIEFPLRFPIEDYIERIIAAQRVPSYSKDGKHRIQSDSLSHYIYIFIYIYSFIDVYSALKKFIQAEHEACIRATYTSAVDDLIDGKLDVNKLCTRIDEAFKKVRFLVFTRSPFTPNQYTFLYATKFCPSDDEIFGRAFNRVIHSPGVHDLIRLEQNFAHAVSNEVSKRNNVLKELDNE